MSIAMLDHAAAEEPPRAAWLARAVRCRQSDAQQGRSFLWCAPALAAGIGIYFALPVRTRPLLLVVGAAVLGALLLWLGRAAAFVLAGGAGGAGLRAGECSQSWQAATPLLAATTGEVTVIGPRGLGRSRSPRAAGHDPRARRDRGSRAGPAAAAAAAVAAWRSRAIPPSARASPSRRRLSPLAVAGAAGRLRLWPQASGSRASAAPGG